MSIPPYGTFNALNLPTWDKEMIQSGFDAVESVGGGWEYLKTYAPPKDQGFMFSEPTGKRLEIEKAIESRYGGHSGASYGWTMRGLERIAKEGWEAYARRTLDAYGPPPLSSSKTELTQFLDAISPSTKDCKPEQKREKFLALPTDMSLDDQAKALRELDDVPMSYSEMRSRFG